MLLPEEELKIEVAKPPELEVHLLADKTKLRPAARSDMKMWLACDRKLFVDLKARVL